ncbi:MAG: efflux RND transporter periplasmic adaptor subunit [Deltaproteobacteria bacterium]
MNKWMKSVFVTLAALGALGGSVRGFSSETADPGKPSPLNAQTDEGAAKDPTARVKTLPIKIETIKEHVTVYGSIIPAPGALQTVSLPFEAQILATMVNDGQKVKKGDILVRLKPSPNTLLKLSQARNTYQLQKESFREMQHRYNLKLATNEQLLAAKQAVEQAKLQMESLTKRGIDGERNIPSNVSGLVRKVYVQEGAIVPAGKTLVEIVEQNRLQAVLGVEPEDIARVHTGQAVSLARVNAPASPPAAGRVREISYAVNPSTRLVDVFVALDSPMGFLLGESISGRIAIRSAQGLVVPRSAVLPEGDKHVLFTVEKGRAVKHVVQIGLESAREYQVSGKNLKAGDQVVIEGNYELSDGMAVTSEAK